MDAVAETLERVCPRSRREQLGHDRWNTEPGATDAERPSLCSHAEGGNQRRPNRHVRGAQYNLLS